ncbi:MAG: hypothetical protein AAGH99_01745 [Planctomycetota bacterium]
MHDSALIDADAEVELANAMARQQYRRSYEVEGKLTGAGGLGWAKGMRPKPSSDKPARPRPSAMSVGEQLAEIVNAWPTLHASERYALVGQLRRSPSIAGRTHVLKMAKATRGQHLMHRVKAAEALGIHPGTLNAWEKRGWISGKVTVSNNTWYPKTEVTKARKLAEKRAKS